MPCCLIGLGANLGDRLQTLERAVSALAQDPHLHLAGRSRWYQTPPVGGPGGQPPYLNGAVVLETSQPPESVAAILRGLESELGRRRGERWGPRTIDIDFLLYDQLVLQTPLLVLPHPRMAWRRFVLEPAAEVAGSMVHPTVGWTVDRLLDHLNTAAAYVAIAGPIGAGKTALAERLASETSARWIAEQIDTRRLEEFYLDPAGQAWTIQLEFLQQRARLLRADLPEWSDRCQWTVSDFWFDQSLAFAEVWLPAGRRSEFCRVFEQARRGVVQPKLTVLLDAPAERLLERVRRRNRPCERSLDRGLLARIRQAVLGQADKPDQGPVLRSCDEDPQSACREVRAAVAAMQY